MNSFKINSLILFSLLISVFFGCVKKSTTLHEVVANPSKIEYVLFNASDNGFDLRIVVPDFNKEFFSNLEKAPPFVSGTGSVYRATIHCKNGEVLPIWVSVDTGPEEQIYFAITDSPKIVDSSPDFLWIRLDKIPYWNNWLMLASWAVKDSEIRRAELQHLDDRPDN